MNELFVIVIGGTLSQWLKVRPAGGVPGVTATVEPTMWPPAPVAPVPAVMLTV
jgi:hypothetical protein